MLDSAFFTLAGVVLGTITGLIPGIHVNTLAVLLLGAYYQYNLPSLPLSFLILGAAVAHAFVGFVPAIFLGAPSEATVLSVAPGHKMLQKGKGYEALFLAVSGGLASVALLAVLFPVLLRAVPAIYGFLRPSIQYILLLAVAFLILKEEKRLWALLVFLLSAAFGILALNSKINSSFVLLPVLSGLFGISTLILSYFTESFIPRQSMKVKFNAKRVIFGSLSGFLGGIIAGLLPGIGSSQSAIIAGEFTRQRGTKNFMSMLGAIAVTDILLSVLAIYLIGNPRSGAAVAIGSLLEGGVNKGLAIAFMGAGMFAAGISAYAALRLGAGFEQLIHAFSYKKAVVSALGILFAVIYYFTGLEGTLIAIVGMLIGVIPNLVGVKKSLLLGCLIAPTLLYFFGISLY